MTDQEIATMSDAPKAPRDDRTAMAGAGDATDHLTSGAWVGEWVLDRSRSSVRFRSTSFWGLSRVKGQFTSMRAEGSLRPDGTARGQLVIDASSVDTGNPKRDDHLRSDDFFHASSYPEITYRLSGITPAGPSQVRMTGKLSIAEHTEPLALTAMLEQADPTGATVSVEAELDRSTWGIGYKKIGMTKMATRVEARLGFTRPS